MVTYGDVEGWFGFTAPTSDAKEWPTQSMITDWISRAKDEFALMVGRAHGTGDNDDVFVKNVISQYMKEWKKGKGSHGMSFSAPSFSVSFGGMDEWQKAAINRVIENG